MFFFFVFFLALQGTNIFVKLSERFSNNITDDKLLEVNILQM